MVSEIPAKWDEIDIIKTQIKDALNDKIIFDTEIDVLLVEKVENLLKEVRSRNYTFAAREKLSLYKTDVKSILSYISDLGDKVSNFPLIEALCSLLIARKTVTANLSRSL